MKMIQGDLNHFLQKVIDLVFSASEVSTLDEMVGLLSPSSGRVVQLEGPQEVGGVLEVGSNSEDLVDQVLNTDDAHLAQLALDDLVGGDGSAVAIDLDKPTLVDQITDSFQVGAAVGDVRLADPEHVGGGLVHLDEDSVVDLPQSEELEDLPDLGRHLVDTTDPHDEGPLEDVDTLLPPVNLGLDGELGPVGSVLSLPLATLENSLWDCGEFSVRHSSLVEVNQAILAW